MRLRVSHLLLIIVYLEDVIELLNLGVVLPMFFICIPLILPMILDSFPMILPMFLE